MSGLIASLHYLALGLGFAGLLLRLRALQTAQRDKEIKRIFYGDNLWGLAALLWVATGFARAFGGLEKGTQYYLQSHGFHLKMGLFILVFLIELYPMIVLVQWRMRRKRTIESSDVAPVLRMIWISRFEMLCLVGIIFAATLMARGR